MIIYDSLCRNCFHLSREHEGGKCLFAPTGYAPLTRLEVDCAITMFDGRLGIDNWISTRFLEYASPESVVVYLEGQFITGIARVANITFPVPISEFRWMVDEGLQ